MTSLAIAMIGLVMLITDFVFGDDTMIASVAIVAIAFLVVWSAMPIRRLLANRDD